MFDEPHEVSTFLLNSEIKMRSDSDQTSCICVDVDINVVAGCAIRVQDH